MQVLVLKYNPRGDSPSSNGAAHGLPPTCACYVRAARGQGGASLGASRGHAGRRYGPARWPAAARLERRSKRRPPPTRSLMRF